MEQIYHAILKGIIILYPILLGCGTVFFYKRNTPAMRRFYMRMVQFESARKLYAIIFFIMLLTYNYSCFDTYQSVTAVMTAHVLMAPFVLHGVIDRILRAMTDSADLLLTALVFLTIYGLVSGHHVVVVTGLTYLVAALFYPASNLYEALEKEEDITSFSDIENNIVRYYYGHPRLYLADYLKHLAQNNGNKVVNNDKEK